VVSDYYELLTPINAPLQITVVNNIPTDYPVVSDGVTIHWHGLNMMSEILFRIGPMESLSIAKRRMFI